MSDPVVPIELPQTDHSTLIWVGIGFGALLLFAVLVEIIRRRANRRFRREAEWRVVEEILEEKALPEDARNAVRSLIKHHAPNEPVRAITTRQHFDRCVGEEMKALLAQGDLKRYGEAGIRLREIRKDLGLNYTPVGQRIYSTRELSSGQAIWISPVEEDPPRWFRTGVSSVDEGHFHVGLRNPKAKQLPSLNPGDEVRCRMWRQDDARYVFTASLDYVKGPPVTWAFRQVTELNRIQSRSYWRVPHDQDVVIGILNAPADGRATDVHFRRVVTKIRGRITNLSAGGFAAVIQQTLPRQVLLRVSLEIPEQEPVVVEARIVTVEPISGERHLLRAEYVGIEDETREVIAHYVMHRQQPESDAQQARKSPQE